MNATGAAQPAPQRPARRWISAVAQVVGFLAGIVLIVWCVQKALAQGGAAEISSQLAAAPTWMLGLLVGSTVVSLLANGFLFWSLARPIASLRLHDLQAVNLLASVLNYAPLPFRLGLLARIGYHWRVDRLSMGTIAAWLAAALLSMVVAFSAAALVLPLAPRVGLAAYAGLVVALAAVGVLVAARFAGWPWLRARLGGGEQCVANRAAFGAATAFRLLDMLAWCVRMVVAARILDLPITATEAALLGLAAVVSSMNPLGRFGFREAAVAWLAATLFAGRLSGEDLGSAFARLAVVESAAEGVATIPLGILGALWCWHRWRQSGAGAP